MISRNGYRFRPPIFNLVAHNHYERVPHYRQLSPKDEQALLQRHMNRVADTCIPEAETMRVIEAAVLEDWMDSDQKGERYFPHEFMYRLLRSCKLRSRYQIDQERRTATPPWPRSSLDRTFTPTDFRSANPKINGQRGPVACS